MRYINSLNSNSACLCNYENEFIQGDETDVNQAFFLL